MEEVVAQNVVPAEVKGWNWGAFVFNIWWGIGNKTYLPLLCLVPLFNIVWIFVCGFKGNEWAWKSNDYPDVASFKRVQATWNRAGLVSFIFSVAAIILYLIFFAAILASLPDYL